MPMELQGADLEAPKRKKRKKQKDELVERDLLPMTSEATAVQLEDTSMLSFGGDAKPGDKVPAAK